MMMENRMENTILYRDFRLPSNPLIIRVLFFLLFSFNKETQNERGKG